MSRTRAFCDGFTLTTPKDNFESVLAGVKPMLDTMGVTKLNDGYYVTPDKAALKYGERGGVGWVQAKGRFVAALVAHRMLSEFLSVWSTGPHRVSSADLSVDEFVDSPALKIQAAYAEAKTGSLRFTRKKIKPSDVSAVLSPTVYDDTGLDTGTVYLGQRTAEAHGRLYDKTQERAAKAGECIALTARHELTVSGKLGITLRDLVEPDSCFYHFWPAGLLDRPSGIPPWSPFAEGFSVERRDRLPADRLKARIEFSTDIEDIIRLAHDCGPEGMTLLHRLIDTKASRLAL